jgi:hypothetical protein
VGEYGLRNKRELWRVQAALSKIRKAARTLLTLDDKVSRWRAHTCILRTIKDYTGAVACASVSGVCSDQLFAYAAWMVMRQLEIATQAVTMQRNGCLVATCCWLPSFARQEGLFFSSWMVAALHWITAICDWSFRQCCLAPACLLGDVSLSLPAVGRKC